MGKEYLIDSNALIDFFNGSMPEKGKELLISASPVISIINQIEIFSSSNISEAELSDLKAFVGIAKVYDVDMDIASETIKLRLKHTIKLADAIIAATAIYYGVTLVTRNVSDFKKIEGLSIINPHNI